MIKRENTRIQITISKKLHKELKNLAEYEGRTVSNMAAKILIDYFKDSKNNID
ncbi:hypothetical protein G8T71_06915 [Clostridium botulinum C/D]|uniref:ribbon-helix-helix domain-containing protein n=1 Tax=Clostridium botulinum TaxID=1491 RepID=UPI0004D83AC3|nr:hypothetical protein [Clostridium botulinum]KEH96132.1 hypothetical protein Z953_p0195 [Clostridium botulinum D str. 16868]MCD3211085.1 hypothetical protein [Clostridium botulinum C/D]